MINIQCDCGKFNASLDNLPKATPGRVACYCDDCQTYLYSLGRKDLLDEAGGTEILPVYPQNIKIESGAEHLKSVRLSPKGLDRWVTTCCNTPIANTRAKFPWVGVLAQAVLKEPDKGQVEKALGPIRSRVAGNFALKTPPEGTSQNLRFHDVKVVMPFVIKGFLFGKSKPSPFFTEEFKPISEPQLMPMERRREILQQLEQIRNRQHEDNSIL